MNKKYGKDPLPMGKSKRIRAERARDIAANPDKYVKSEDSKRTKLISIVLIVVIAAILFATIAVSVLSSTGIIFRMQTAMSSDNYTINGSMMAYLYYTQYNYYYNMYASIFGSSVSSYLSTIRTNSLSGSRTEAQKILILCEAAKAAGIKLEDEDLKKIDENIKSIEDTVRESKTNVSAYFGNVGINIGDIREIVTLATLAQKYEDMKMEEFENNVKDDEAAIKKYIADHMSKFYKADYLTFTVDEKEYADALAALTTPEAFKAKVIEILALTQYEKEFKTASTKLEPADKPVKALAEAIKQVLAVELQYTLLDKDETDLDEKYGFGEKSTIKERLEAIFEDLYKDKTFEAGEGDTDSAKATTISDSLYNALVTVEEAIAKNAKTALGKALNEGAAYSLPDAVVEEEEDHEDHEGHDHEKEEAEKKEPTESEKWIFDAARKENETTVIENKSESKTTYTAMFCIKPIYLNEEITKDVSHILIKVETQKVPSYTNPTAEQQKEIDKIKADNDKAFETKKPDAEKILNDFNALTEKGREAFEKFAEGKNEDSNHSYDAVRKGEMVEEFEDWLFAEERKEGDTGLVKTEYGWHIMYFAGDNNPVWKEDAINAHVSDAFNKWYDALPHKVTINDKTIANVCG